MSEAFGNFHLFQVDKQGDPLNNYTSTNSFRCTCINGAFATPSLVFVLRFGLRESHTSISQENAFFSSFSLSLSSLFFIPFPFSFLHLFCLSFFFFSSRINYYPPPFDRKGLLFENGKTFPFLKHLRDQLIQALVEFNSTRFFLIVRPHCEATKPLTFWGITRMQNVKVKKSNYYLSSFDPKALLFGNGRHSHFKTSQISTH